MKKLVLGLTLLPALAFANPPAIEVANQPALSNNTYAANTHYTDSAVSTETTRAEAAESTAQSTANTAVTNAATAQSTANAAIPSSTLGAASGPAKLDSSGNITANTVKVGTTTQSIGTWLTGSIAPGGLFPPFGNFSGSGNPQIGLGAEDLYFLASGLSSPQFADVTISKSVNQSGTGIYSALNVNDTVGAANTASGGTEAAAIFTGTGNDTGGALPVGSWSRVFVSAASTDNAIASLSSAYDGTGESVASSGVGLTSEEFDLGATGADNLGGNAQNFGGYGDRNIAHFSVVPYDGPSTSTTKFAGSISGTTLTVTSVTTGTLVNNMHIAVQSGYDYASTGALGLEIVSQLSGTTGGVGTYQLNKSIGSPGASQFYGTLYPTEVVDGVWINTNGVAFLDSAVAVSQGSQLYNVIDARGAYPPVVDSAYTTGQPVIALNMSASLAQEVIDFGGDLESTPSTKAVPQRPLFYSKSAGCLEYQNVWNTTTLDSWCDNGSFSPSGLIIPASGVGIQGDTTSATPPAGSIGETMSSDINSGSAVSLTTATPTNITSVSLTAGYWQCSGDVFSLPAGTTTTSNFRAWISTASAALPSTPEIAGEVNITAAWGAGTVVGMPTGTVFKATSSGATIYLETQMNFATSTMGAYGSLTCVRLP